MGAQISTGKPAVHGSGLAAHRDAPRDPLPLSLLNDLLYCQRRAALKIVEGMRSANFHTLRGDLAHVHSDLPGYEVVQGTRLLRALPVWSERLGLTGKCDIVELRPDEALYPVEFKVGKRRKWGNDDAQLCAQAFCLEEMFGVPVPCGAIFHADSKRRREVPFTQELRVATEAAICRLHDVALDDALPPSVYRDACEACSLFEVCLPKATGADGRALSVAQSLFDV